ncbi:hypothetical protein EDB85DRAFT_1897909 [Lactarius pseudohatsudake]|nr:hypothetical protein EDB85DRAFT_1897909 [Lactarius pseudohatsudake]
MPGPAWGPVRGHHHRPPHCAQTPSYGAHHSKEQVTELIALSLDTLKLVNCWLKHHGVSPSSISRTHGGGWLMVSGVPVSRANELLASYQLYWHAGTNVNFPHGRSPLHTSCSAGRTRANHRTDNTLRLHGYAADSAHPLQWSSGIARGGASGELKDVLSCRDVRVTPVFLRVLSGTVKYEPAATDRNVLGVTGYLGQYPPESLGPGIHEKILQ